MVVKTVLLLLSILTFFTLVQLKSNSDDDKGHFIFTIPNVLRIGQRESACLSFHGENITGPANVTITIHFHNLENYAAITKKTINTENAGCFDFKVPDIYGGVASFYLQVQFLNDVKLSINSMNQIQTYIPKEIIIVQTDREIYKPGDRVKIRILKLTQEYGVPKNLVIPVVQIRNPIQIAIGQWENVTTDLGLVQLEHQLSVDTMLGTWKIELPESKTTFKTFEVKEYSLPRFEVNIIHPKKVYYNTDFFNFTVCGKYSYGEKVKGTAQVKLLLEFQTLSLNQFKELENGCADFSFEREEIPIIKYKTFGMELLATIMENGTEHAETVESRLDIFYEKYKLQLSESSQYFQPGMPYKGKMQIFDSFEKYTNQTLEICYNVGIENSWNLTDEKCSQLRINENNSVEFVILPFDDGVHTINIKAKLLNDEENNYYVLRKSIHRWYSTSNNYLQIEQLGKKSVKCRTWQQYQVLYNFNETQENESITFNYMIISKKHILKLAKNIQTPNVSEHFDEYENIIGNENIKPSSPINKFILNIRIQPKLFPDASLLVYYIHRNGELIGNTQHIRIENCLGSKIEANWLNRQKYPGETATLKIKTTGNSLCAVSAVDKSSTFKRNSFYNLETILRHANDQPKQYYDEAVYACKSDTYNPPFIINDQLYWDLRKKRFISPDTMSYDTRQAFKDFGVSLITDFEVVTRPCEKFHANTMKGFMGQKHGETPALYQTQVADKGVSIRTNFPETWLWELVHIGRNGEAQFKRELPHTITNWVTDTVCISPNYGIGISATNEIKTFQPFFIDVLTPNNIKKGEIIHIKVIVFNYLNHSLPVSIKFHENKHVQLIGPTEDRQVITCIESDDSVGTIFRIQANHVGKVNLTFDAEVDSSYPGVCGPEILLNRRDMVVKSILVRSEGFPIEETKSALVCTRPNEGIKKVKVEWNLELPNEVVKNSSQLRILLDADLLGSTAENLGSLLQIPNGCGEQIMSTLTPNLFILRYLNATNNLNEEIRRKAIRNIKIGYERILQYKHEDGSFSAFTNENEGSTFLTAFVIRTLSQCAEYVYIDESVLKHTMYWLQTKQLENGCFPTTSHVFHPNIKDENGGSIALTAYIIISLLESGLDVPKDLLVNADYCFKSINTFDKYTLAITTYALSLLGNHMEKQVNKSLEKLSEMSIKNNSLIWWEDKDSLSSSIEMTAYVVMTLLRTNNTENISQASRAIRWIMTQRNAYGGFISTQDTVVALDALTRYALLIKSKETNLTVSVQANGKEFLYRIRDKDKLKTKQFSLKVVPNTLKFRIHGTGCVLLQSILHYNTHIIISSEAFKLAVAVSSVSTIDKCSIAQISPCLSYITPEHEMNMAVLEIMMPSGYKPDRATLHRLIQNQKSKVRRFEEKNDKVVLYFTELNNEQTCLSFLINENSAVEARTPAIMHLYDYYNPSMSVFSSYEVPKCISENIMSFSDDNSTNLLEKITNHENNGYIVNDDYYKIINSTISTGLNPDFVDKDVSLEYPDGIEGPKPVYVKPPPAYNATGV